MLRFKHRLNEATRIQGTTRRTGKSAISGALSKAAITTSVALTGCALSCGLFFMTPMASWADDDFSSIDNATDVLVDSPSESDGASDASEEPSSSAAAAKSNSAAASSAAAPSKDGASKNAPTGDVDVDVDADDDDDDEADDDFADADINKDVDKGPASVGDTSAMKDALNNVNNEIDSKLAEIDRITADIEKSQSKASDTKERIKKLDKRIKKLLNKIEKRQKEQADLQKHASELTRTMYKNRGDLNIINMLDGVASLNEAFEWMDMRDRVLAEYDNVLADVKDKQAELQEDYEQASLDKDAQLDLEEELADEQEDLVAKQKRLEKAVEKLRKRAEKLDFNQKAKLAEAAAAAHKVAKTFKTGELADAEGAKWHTGLASAYGGSSDDTTPQDTPTATGTMCDDWSMGVAVPLAWGPSKYYGRRVEISYEGRSVIATVVDCGGMNNGERALDLQPGVFKAFGAKDCDDWGVRKVRYRFL